MADILFLLQTDLWLQGILQTINKDVVEEEEYPIATSFTLDSSHLTGRLNTLAGYPLGNQVEYTSSILLA